MKTKLLALCLVLGLAVSFGFQPAHADTGPVHTLIPIGADYTAETLQRFALAAAQRDTNGSVDLLVIPITYGTDAYSTTNGERQKNITLAEGRTAQIQDACNVVKRSDQVCRAVLAPVLIRSDAYLQSNLDLFVPDLDGMYILGGDQTIGMEVVANTPFEDAMANAFGAGAVVSGNSAGAAVQSRNMINGYVGNFGPENGFQQGTVDLWTYDGPTDNTRGLRFGISNAIFEQHAFQRGRIARLINASFTTGLLGIGPDAATGAVITDESTLTDVVGETATIIVDLQTFNATGRFAGPTNSLSVHGLTTHLIPPGGFGYDLTHRRPLVDGKPLAAPSLTGRAFGALHLPTGYGPLILAGDLRGDASGAVSQRFVTLSGGQANGRIVVLALGYAKSSDAQADAKAYAGALQTLVSNPVQWFVVDSKVDRAAVQAAISAATGIFVTAPDQSLILPAFADAPVVTSALRNGWAGGKVLLADNAAAAALGQAISVNPAPTSAGIEDDAMVNFLLSGVTIRPGLNWLPGVAIEPRMVLDRHWGRMYNQLYRNHSLLGLGIDASSAVELIPTGAKAWGLNTVGVFDGRYASYALGSNGALSERYVMLDTYVQGDAITP